MNIYQITSRMQNPIDVKKKSQNEAHDAEFGKNFATILMNEMLKTTNIMGDSDGMSYPGMFRWQMAQFLSEAISEKLNLGNLEGGDLRSIAKNIAESKGVEPKLVEAVIETESAWRENAISPKGAKGLMQLMDSTAERFGVKDSLDPIQNIEGGVDYLKELIDLFGDTKLAIAAYNAGEGNVQRYGGIPPFQETINYVDKITKLLESAKNNEKQ